jgi:hypothetical protein
LSTPNRYSQIIERIFFSHYKEGTKEVQFHRTELEAVAAELNIKLPKNLGDVVYSFRYRAILPESVRKKAPKGERWIIRPAGRALYKFVSIPDRPLVPNPVLAQTKVPMQHRELLSATRSMTSRPYWQKSVTTASSTFSPVLPAILSRTIYVLQLPQWVRSN